MDKIVIDELNKKRLVESCNKVIDVLHELSVVEKMAVLQILIQEFPVKWSVVEDKDGNLVIGVSDEKND